MGCLNSGPGGAGGGVVLRVWSRIPWVPWAPLLCMTKTELIQVAWHFSAYSHLCAQSTVSVYWLSWRPRTMCRGGCWNKEEPNSSSNTRKGMAAFSKGKAGVRFSPFCAAFLPLSQLCHCRAKNSLGQREDYESFPEGYGILLRIPVCLCPCLSLFCPVTLLMHIV